MIFLYLFGEICDRSLEIHSNHQPESYHSQVSFCHRATLLIFLAPDGAAPKCGLFCRALRGVTFAELGILAHETLGKMSPGKVAKMEKVEQKHEVLEVDIKYISTNQKKSKKYVQRDYTSNRSGTPTVPSNMAENAPSVLMGFTRKDGELPLWIVSW